jgi:hypothetical protein
MAVMCYSHLALRHIRIVTRLAYHMWWELGLSSPPVCSLSFVASGLLYDFRATQTSDFRHFCLVPGPSWL